MLDCIYEGLNVLPFSHGEVDQIKSDIKNHENAALVEEVVQNCEKVTQYIKSFEENEYPSDTSLACLYDLNENYGVAGDCNSILELYSKDIAGI